MRVSRGMGIMSKAKMPKAKMLSKGGSTNWISGAIKKPGALRASLGVKGDKPIPAKKLAKAAKAPGKLGQRARLAQTLRGFAEGGRVKKFEEGGKVPKTIMENLRQTNPIAAAVGDFTPIVSSVVNAAEYAQHMRNGVKHNDQDSFDQAKWDAAGMIPFAKPAVRLGKGLKYTYEKARDQLRKQVAEASRATNIQNTPDYFSSEEEPNLKPKPKPKNKSPMYPAPADTAAFRAKRDKPKGMKAGGSVNEAGNYTKPGLRKKIVAQVKATATHGTKAGQWSARKAQLVAKKYKDAGGGYRD